MPFANTLVLAGDSVARTKDNFIPNFKKGCNLKLSKIVFTYWAIIKFSISLIGQYFSLGYN